VEQVRPLPDLEKMAEAYFSPNERGNLRRAAPEARLRLFLQYWTRKEAYLKARGDGLAGLLPQLDVSGLPIPESALTPFPGLTDDPRGWSLLDFSSDPGCVASLVVEGYNLQAFVYGL
jgi:4'-phosphopantetheinyl transferase